jgi:hypothetical protein
MTERRKIVIETGGGEPLPTPHFDAEATMTARPVVPLSEQETYRTNQGTYGARPAKPFWRRPALLIPLILAAVGIGVAAGFAIGIYRSRNAAQAPVAAAPAQASENTDLGQAVEPPQAQEEKVIEPVASAPIAEDKEEKKEPEENVAAATPKDEERERPVRNEKKADDDDDNEARPSAVVKPPVVTREKKPIKVDEYEIIDEQAERQAERERRREDRRERRRRQRQDELTIPRGIERGAREVDRIREIFEGRQP